MPKKPTKPVEKPAVPRGILARGSKVLDRFLVVHASDAEKQEAVMRIMQIGAVAERGGWMKEVRHQHKCTATDALIEYGMSKDRRDKKLAQGLGGITYKSKGKPKQRPAGNK